jgi:hypothetical protein
MRRPGAQEQHAQEQQRLDQGQFFMRSGARHGEFHSQATWNGIGGVHGRIRLGDTGLFIPYYFDIGAGGSQLTWQAAGGLGYQKGWAGASLTYRYLSFEQGGSALVHHIALGGPMLAVNFNF